MFVEGVDRQLKSMESWADSKIGGLNSSRRATSTAPPTRRRIASKARRSQSLIGRRSASVQVVLLLALVPEQGSRLSSQTQRTCFCGARLMGHSDATHVLLWGAFDGFDFQPVKHPRTQATPQALVIAHHVVRQLRNSVLLLFESTLYR